MNHTSHTTHTAEVQYLRLLRNVLENGAIRGDRTGTGTISLFAPPMLEIDVRTDFPLLTTKKMFTKGMIYELLWFIAGDTNVRYLQDNGVRFWDAWADDQGDLGPVYGSQLRSLEYSKWVNPLVYQQGPIIPTEHATVFEVGILGDYDKADPFLPMLQNTWREMLRRCYHEDAKSYVGYGAKGVHVEPRWFDFSNFQADVKRVPGWILKAGYPNDYSLDKDILRASNRYGRDTCSWASREEQSYNTTQNMPFSATSPEGIEHVFYSLGQAHRREGLHLSAMHRCLKGEMHTHHDWSNFQYVVPVGSEQVIRTRHTDQLKETLASLMLNLESRRHLITLWNPSQLHLMRLPPCHGIVIQLYIDSRDNSLHMFTHQRSADLFLGVPVNIASYATLLIILAQALGYEVGTLKYTFGDAHIYSNHVDQVKEQLSRTPRKSPTLAINMKRGLNPQEALATIENLTSEDFKLTEYDPHPKLSAPVAI